MQADLKHFPFKVVNRNGKPTVSVEYRGERKEFVSHWLSYRLELYLTSFLVT